MAVNVRIVVQPAWARSLVTLPLKTVAAFRQIGAAFARLPRRIDSYINPATIAAVAFGFWRLTADLEWTGWFPVSSGFFSHWQAWIALAIAIKFGATALVAKFRLDGKDPVSSVKMAK